MKKFNVVSGRKFTGRDGQEKTHWLSVGKITEFDNGNQILELNMLPGSIFQVFPDDKAEKPLPKMPPIVEEVQQNDPSNF